MKKILRLIIFMILCINIDMVYATEKIDMMGVISTTNKNQEKDNKVYFFEKEEKNTDAESDVTNEIKYMPIVLMYHSLTKDDNSVTPYVITQNDFEKDIKLLIDYGYKFYTASEISEKIKNNDFREKSVVITFDDGYNDNYELAVPVLKRYNAKATIFIIGSLVDKKGYMTSEKIKNLSECSFIEIGNHSYSIHNESYDNLKKKYDDEDISAIVNDFYKNKIFIEKIINKSVFAVSYPYGIYTDVADKKIKEFSNISFSSNESLLDDFNLPVGRFNRYPNTDIKNILDLNNIKEKNEKKKMLIKIQG